MDNSGFTYHNSWGFLGSPWSAVILVFVIAIVAYFSFKFLKRKKS